MTDSDGEWVTFHDAHDYQVSHRGKIRSFKREPGGYVMKPRLDGDGYRMFNYTDDNGVRHSNVSVARTVLLHHDPDGYRPGLHACHGPGGKEDNRYPENLRWDTPDANREEALAVRLENRPPKVKPPKACPRCGAEHEERGKNCRACFEGIGVKFAQLLADGVPPEKAAEQVDYPLNGALNLAVRYGSLRFVAGRRLPRIIDLEPHAVGYRQSRPGRLRRVINRARASRQNSDGA